LTPAQFQQKILTWFDQHGRKDLPWQQDITPYRVWVSEIMLQQTQVTTVIPYFHRFMENFPDIHALATAPQDAVLHLWSGLGYYARARNLHRCAQQIVADDAGEFPTTLDELQSLPGIGRSTAGAILSIALHQPTPILDGNVKRVLCRFHAVAGWSGNNDVAKTLWTFAEKYTPNERCEDYTQAMMDLGATLCTRTKPDCPHCPIHSHCQAYQLDQTGDFPYKKPKTKMPVRSIYCFIIYNSDGSILLEQRPPTGIWGSLWCLPLCATDNDIQHWVKEHYGYIITDFQTHDAFRHTFSHFHWDITPIVITLMPSTILSTQIMETAPQLWYDPAHPFDKGLPAPIKKLLANTPCETNP